MIAGLLLMIVGPLTVSLALPPDLIWSDEDAKALAEASIAHHEAAHHAGHRHGSKKGGSAISAASHDAAAQAARAELEKQRARLKAAQSRQSWLSYGLRGLGAVIALVGVAAYFRARLSSD